MIESQVENPENSMSKGRRRNPSRAARPMTPLSSTSSVIGPGIRQASSTIITQTTTTSEINNVRQKSSHKKLTVQSQRIESTSELSSSSSSSFTPLRSVSHQTPYNTRRSVHKSITKDNNQGNDMKMVTDEPLTLNDLESSNIENQIKPKSHLGTKSTRKQRSLPVPQPPKTMTTRSSSKS